MLVLWAVVISMATGAAVAVHPATATATAMAAPATAPQSPEAAAMAKARATGERVEVEASTTETQRLFANPTGTITLEQTAVPVRVRRGTSWTPVNTELRRRADGMIAPTAAVVDVAFSGGGAESPLMRVARGGHAAAFSWPDALPAPVLDGDTATYAEVLPGVDLKVRALVDGFTQVLVVKTAAAAAQAALRRVQFGATVTGGSLRADAGGGFSVVDESGAAWFVSPQATMWDSSGGSAGGEPKLRQRSLTDSASDPREHGPQGGDQVASMAVEVDAANLTVVPDADLLKDAQFPLYLDPPMHPAARTAWTMVNRTFPETKTWRWGNGSDNRGEGVGWTNKEGTHLKRLIWGFDPRPIWGKTIRNATFSAFNVWSDSCDATPIELWMTWGITASTNWTTQPTWVRSLDSATVANGRAGCRPNGQLVDLTATSAVAEAAAKRWSSMNLGLRARDEKTSAGWKRFHNNAVLSIEYNSLPGTPTGLRTTSPVTSCKMGANPPAIPNDPPIFVARTTDVDGSKGQLVRT
ncbi:MAG TPA: hypothetical protein VEX37_08925, partial [Thermomicrobiales bacterium]|nr:hypothetical protein [Thermomicrobiales bacterium]